MKYHGKISFIIDKEHPDIKYVPDWEENKVLTVEDIYIFSNRYGYSKDYIVDYIKHDLSLVAGGGYNTDHIHNIVFEIEKCV